MGVNFDACASCGHSQEDDHRIKTAVHHERGSSSYLALRRECSFDYGDFGTCRCSVPLTARETADALRKEDRRDAFWLLPATIILLVTCVLVVLLR